MARLERKLSEPPRRITALPDFRHSTPASAATLGRLSKITPIDAERHAHALDGHAVRPLPALGDGADGIGDGRARRRRRRPSHRSRACVSVSRSMKAEVAPPAFTSATSSALAARIFVGIGADRPLDRFQRPVLLLRRRQRQHPRSRRGRPWRGRSSGQADRRSRRWPSEAVGHRWSRVVR